MATACPCTSFAVPTHGFTKPLVVAQVARASGTYVKSITRIVPCVYYADLRSRAQNSPGGRPSILLYILGDGALATFDLCSPSQTPQARVGQNSFGAAVLSARAHIM